MRQHLLRSFKVRDDPIKQWSNHRNIAGLPSIHLLRLKPNRHYLSGDDIDSDQGWLIHHHAASAHIDDGRRRTHVYCHRIGNQISQSAHTHERCCLAHERHTISYKGIDAAKTANCQPASLVQNSLRQSIVQCHSILCDEGTRESSVEALSVGRCLSWPLCSMKRMKTVTVGPGWPLKSFATGPASTLERIWRR